MPLIEVSLVQGRAPEQLRSLIAAVSEAAATALDAPKSSVRVLIRELPPTHWAAGDVTIAERKAGS